MTIGILGGGQLGQMLAQAAAELGHECMCYDPNPSACAQSVAELMVGEYADAALLQKFAERCDCITYEFENVPVLCVQWLEERKIVYPSSAVLHVTQDRWFEKSLCSDLGIPVGLYKNIEQESQLHFALEEFEYRAVLKTRRNGYDGKGQVVIRSEDDVPEAVELCRKQPCIVEAFVPFLQEFSQISTRSPNGNIAFYPLVRNTHRNGILHLSEVPVEVSNKKVEQAKQISTKLNEHFNYVGTMTVELFDTPNGFLLNEIAPRVHNSGHWTIEGAQTSQFSNHIRAITSDKLGDTDCNGYSRMINIIGIHPDRSTLDALDNVYVHYYGKNERPGRKLGHVTVHSSDKEYVKQIAEDIVQASI